MPDPLLIPCEGSGCPGHHWGGVTAMCSMCGEFYPTLATGELIRHNRRDILTMIDRGDFDA